ncbi:MAG: phosphate ABC transporter ATP-binding protein, partial [Microbacteriaceae bacterium]|nr:phosphate ABC transporter ATP-binding protein [Microbacteriaceae bacterium]
FVGSVLHHLPDAESLQRIRRIHRGRLVQLHVENRETDDPFLSRVARHHGVDFNIVYGGVSELQSRLFGSLTVELLGPDEAVDAAVAELRGHAEVAEFAR